MLSKAAVQQTSKKKGTNNWERTMVLMDTKQLCFIVGSLQLPLPSLNETFFIGSSLTLLAGFDGDMCHLDTTIHN
jgi:hypothetical protein